MDDILLTEVQSKISQMIAETGAPGKHSARSAVSHLKKGWKLRPLDPEMAVFRAMTGEEESVTAIFQSLRRLQYINAEKLNPRNHVHKAALQPFLAAMENNFYLAKMENLKPALELDLNEEIPRFKTRISVLTEAGKEFFAYPIPPLNFSVKQNGKVYNFADELLQVTNQQTIAKVIDHVRSLANRRNRVLYASNQGVPEVRDLPESFFLTRRDRIFRNLTLYLLIDPHPVQLFVQQALNAFLEMLGLLPKELESENPSVQAAYKKPYDDAL